MFNKLSKGIFTIFISTVISETAIAQQLDSSIINQTHKLSEVTVTATRTETELDKVPRKVDIITKKEIESTSAADLTDLLKKQAGLDIVQYPGMLSGVSVRGFRPQYGGINQRTLVLIDGRPAGATNLSMIDPNTIERVEVLKGPGSALYGSQAMGGVVNLITRKSKDALSLKVFGGVGSFGVVEGGISIGGRITKKIDFDFIINGYRQGRDYRIGERNVWRNTFGFNQAQRIQRISEEKDSIFNIDDKKGSGQRMRFTSFNKNSGLLRVGYSINNNWRIDIKGESFNGNKVNAPFDLWDENSTPYKKDLSRFSSDIMVSGKLSPSNSVTIKAFTAKEKSETYSVPWDEKTEPYNFYKSYTSQYRWNGFQLQDNHQVGSHTFTAGFDYNSTEVENNSYEKDGNVYPVSSRYPNSQLNTAGIYAQGAFNFLSEKLNITAGGRFESINNKVLGTPTFEGREQMNNIFNPSIAASFKLVKGLRVRSSYGTAFTTVDAFSVAGYSESSVWGKIKTVDIWQGNPDLKNQMSNTLDFGAEFKNLASGISVEGGVFFTKVKNNVVYTSRLGNNQLTANGDTINNIKSFVNAEASNINGIEAAFSYDFGSLANYKYSLRIFANVTKILKAEEVQELAFLGKQTVNMSNVADVNLNYGLEYTGSKRLNFKLSGRYVGNRYDWDWQYTYQTFNYTDIKYPGFMVLDFYSAVSITPRHQISLFVNNLTDENYYEKRGFNMPGRNFLLRYTFSL